MLRKFIKDSSRPRPPRSRPRPPRPRSSQLQAHYSPCGLLPMQNPSRRLARKLSSPSGRKTQFTLLKLVMRGFYRGHEADSRTLPKGGSVRLKAESPEYTEKGRLRGQWLSTPWRWPKVADGLVVAWKAARWEARLRGTRTQQGLVLLSPTMGAKLVIP